MIAEVEDDAEAMEQVDELFLVVVFGDGVVNANTNVLGVTDEVLFELF